MASSRRGAARNSSSWCATTPEVDRAVRDNYARLFGVRYTDRAKPDQRLAALAAIGDTRSAARASLLRLAPDITARSTPAIRHLPLRGSALADLFEDYSPAHRERVLAYLAENGIETQAELRDRSAVWPELLTVLGDEYMQRAERSLRLAEALGWPLNE